MKIEIVRTLDTGDYRLWDGDRLLADCGKGVEGEERAKALWDEITNLQMANDELRVRIEQAGAAYQLAADARAEIERKYEAAVRAEHAAERRAESHYRDHTALRRQLEAVEARYAAAVAALEPFAQFYGAFAGRQESNDDDTAVAFNGFPLTLGHFRMARAAVATTTEKGHSRE